MIARLSPGWSSLTTKIMPRRPRVLSPSRKSFQLVELSRLAISTPSTWRRPSQSIRFFQESACRCISYTFT